MADADDLAQDLLVSLLRAQQRRRVPTDRAYLKAATRLAAVDLYRRAARDQAVCDRNAVIGELWEAGSPDLGADVAQAVTDTVTAQGELARLFEKLTDEQRRLLWLRIGFGWSAEQVAAALGSTPGAVRVAQHRALARLRAAAGVAR